MDNDNDVLLLIPHLVAGVPAVVVQALVDTVGHASCQSRTVLRSDQQTPDPRDLFDEVLPAGALEVLDLVLHPIPAIFYVFKSGEFPGQSIKGISSSLKKFMTDFALWQGAEPWRK